MSKELQTVIEKAVKTGYANKNGRMHDYGYVGPLESKWEAHYNKDIDSFCLYHSVHIPLFPIFTDKVNQIGMH